MTLLYFIGGLAGLILGANLLVRGASRLALSAGISPLVVGLTIVAFGTSSPELAVSVGAVAAGQTDIAIGNVVGSNVLNVLLILGISALITPLVVHLQLIRQEVPIMIGAGLLLVVFAVDGQVRWYEAAMLTAAMWLTRCSWCGNRAARAATPKATMRPRYRRPRPAPGTRSCRRRSRSSSRAWCCW